MAQTPSQHARDVAKLLKVTAETLLERPDLYTAEELRDLDARVLPPIAAFAERVRRARENAERGG